MKPSLRKLAVDAELNLPGLKGHGERTASFAVATAEAMGVPAGRLVSLRIAAALHHAFGPCGDPDRRLELADEPQAADFIRGTAATWNMAPLEASILNAACELDRINLGIAVEPRVYRPGVAEALAIIAKIVTPVDYVS